MAALQRHLDDAVSFELSNDDDFTLANEDGGYVLTTGPETGVSTSVNIGLPGLEEKVEIAQLKIDKVYGITAQFAGASSSTLTFTWTEGGSAEEDIAKPYTISLYRMKSVPTLKSPSAFPPVTAAGTAVSPSSCSAALPRRRSTGSRCLTRLPMPKKTHR